MDLTAFLQYVAALVFVIALILAIAWAMRRFGMSGAIGGLGHRRNPRLAVVEALSIDGRRRLLLVRRDGTEHLLLLGATQDMLIESGIPAAVADQGGLAAGLPASAPAPVAARPPARPAGRVPPHPQPQPQPQPQPLPARDPLDDGPAGPAPRARRPWP